MKSRRTWIIILALLGIIVSGYLTWSHYSGVPVYCGGGVSSCETVNSSRYAYLGPIPVALLGLLAYLAILVFSLIPSHEERQWPDILRFGLALIGVMFQWYLFYVEAAILHAFCYWCISSQALITLIFILSLPTWQSRSVTADNAQVEPHK